MQSHQSKNNYIIFSIKNAILSDYLTLFTTLSTEMKGNFSYTIDEDNKINFYYDDLSSLKNYSSFSEAEQALDHNLAQFIVEYNVEDHRIIALHDFYFSKNVENNGYKVELDHLYLVKKKYEAENEINLDRLFDSLAYGVLKEISQHHSLEIPTAQRGLSLVDFLYQHPPRESYEINKKSISTKKLAFHFFNNKANLSSEIIKRIFCESRKRALIPQINLDNLDFKELEYALEHAGSFELTGPTIDRLKQLAKNVLKTAREIFNLPLETLKKVEYTLSDFNGFQNVREESLKKYQEKKADVVRNQYAYHFKPYLNAINSKIPEGIDLQFYETYYRQCLILLNTLFRKIAVHYGVDFNAFTDYLNDKKSVLTSRKYIPREENDEKSTTGIPKHSDYGFLTLVISDVKGLEVEIDGRWVEASSSPDLHVFINFGDWFGFILQNLGVNCKMGIHQVPDVAQVRHSLAFFLNPKPEHVVQVPNGESIPYETYLKSPKVPYINKKSS